MQRTEDWPEKMNAAIDAKRAAAAEWGVFDCCLFPADVVQAMTGVDCAAEFRGKYTDADGAFALIQPYGGTLATLLEDLAERHGWTEWPHVNYAQRGDVLLLSPNVIAGEARFGGVMAICIGHRAMFVGQHRLLVTSMEHAVRAWHIP